jgi:flagellar hook protein FlgE
MKVADVRNQFIKRTSVMISVIRSGMNASLKQLDVLSNNIANARTTGFKKSQATFEDIYADKTSFGPSGKIGHGSLNSDVRIMRSQGALEQTSEVLDLAIEGEGMFIVGAAGDNVETTAYFTRDGSFQLDQAGFISSPEGLRLKSVTMDDIEVPTSITEDGAILFLSSLSIDETGSVNAKYGEDTSRVLAQIGMAQFPDISQLQENGRNLFRSTNASGAAEVTAAFTGTNGRIMTGTLEMSNINMSSELTTMIQAQQAFSGSSRLLQSETEMLRRLIG